MFAFVYIDKETNGLFCKIDQAIIDGINEEKVVELLILNCPVEPIQYSTMHQTCPRVKSQSADFQAMLYHLPKGVRWMNLSRVVLF